MGRARTAEQVAGLECLDHELAARRDEVPTATFPWRTTKKVSAASPCRKIVSPASKWALAPAAGD